MRVANRLWAFLIVLKLFVKWRLMFFMGSICDCLLLVVFFLMLKIGLREGF